MEDSIAEYFDLDLNDGGQEPPWWYYAHLTETTRTALADRDPALLRCSCGRPVTAAKLAASGADDGPAYVFCEACYQRDLHAAQSRHIPLAIDAVSIGLFDILWS